MRKKYLQRPAMAAAVAGALVAVVTSVSAVTANSAGDDQTTPQPTPVSLCGEPKPGHVACLAEALPGGSSSKLSRSQKTPAGYGPADIQSAYGLAEAVQAQGGKGRTVAIVDAFDAVTAEADLAVYRSQYGLPPCTTDNGCFRKVNQRGDAAPLPEADASWGLEISLDLDAVSAACPSCNILLVESDGASLDQVADAVDTAVRLGASVVSNSYGMSEFGPTDAQIPPTTEPFRQESYNHPGVPIVAASGDWGYQLSASYPASLSSVIAVGGTTLNKSDNARGWTETAWAANARGSGAGAGCSAVVAKPAWQRDKDCPGRTVADVSAVADPYTGVAVYDSTPVPGSSLTAGWMKVGGTSAATPLIAAMYALSGNTENVRDASGLYAHRDQLHDVVGGSVSVLGSGQECPASSYLCNARKGYDAPTGLGTPNGLGVFVP